MQVWELVAKLMKEKAGAEVYIVNDASRESVNIDSYEGREEGCAGECVLLYGTDKGPKID